MTRERLVPAAVVAVILGIGLIALQRWVAETKFATIVLIGVWFVVVGVGAFLFVRRSPESRLPVLGTFAAIVVGSVAIGYWTGFRDTEVDEDVVVATAEASGAERSGKLRSPAPSLRRASLPWNPTLLSQLGLRSPSPKSPSRLRAGSSAGRTGTMDGASPQSSAR